MKTAIEFSNPNLDIIIYWFNEPVMKGEHFERLVNGKVILMPKIREIKIFKGKKRITLSYPEYLSIAGEMANIKSQVTSCDETEL